MSWWRRFVFKIKCIINFFIFIIWWFYIILY